MKIEDDELNALELVGILTFPDTLIQSVQNLITSLREAQELIEKFEPVIKIIDTNAARTPMCVYCNSTWELSFNPLRLKHKSYCPYAIRERLGYGQKETKDG